VNKKKVPPIQLYGLEGRYATAIYTAAAKKNQLSAVEKDFQNISVS
jgi:F-type H+-transporting ATPase subunit O